MAAAATTPTITGVNRNSTCLRNRNRGVTDFSEVGGLCEHLTLLNDMIIVPLLYGDLYKRFYVKASRGVLFFGPPGTGKTLVASALATELARTSGKKVIFYQRKGADVLDKWLGESERKLRDLFTQAIKNRPSVIFFDELDGLAPVRSQKNDQVHCSVVTTLLALMDGLDKTPGVIVIGATNRIDAIDPALRRPGRFDRELYFPLPSVSARKEILEVHTKFWTPAPSQKFLTQLAELTCGCCGADLQALCGEAVVCCLKRLHPNVFGSSVENRIRINVDEVVVQEIDFLNARMNLIPTSHRLGNYKVRKLSPFIKPLLQRQLDNILHKINVFLPHFTEPFKKFLIGSERYAGRLVIKGNSQQGLSMHIIPAVLQALEHIPCYILDVPTSFETKIQEAQQNLPSILVLSRVDDWWNLIDSSTQLALEVMLEDLLAGLPLFVIATCNTELPLMLHSYFYNNSSIIVQMEDPTVKEREQFFGPLFLSDSEFSVSWVFKNMNCTNRIVDSQQEPDSQPEQTERVSKRKKRNVDELQQEEAMVFLAGKRQKKEQTRKNLRTVRGRPAKKNTCIKVSKCKNCRTNRMNNDVSEGALQKPDQQYPLLCPPEEFVFEGQQSSKIKDNNLTSLCSTIPIKQEPISQTPEEHNLFHNRVNCWEYAAANPEMTDVVSIWKRTVHVTSDCFSVGQLEMLYDAITACISEHKFNYNELKHALYGILIRSEATNLRDDSDRLDECSTDN